MDDAHCLRRYRYAHRNNRMYGATSYGHWVMSWPSVHGMGTFIEQNNTKEPVKSNMPAPPPIDGDANGDGFVNLQDYNIVAMNMGRENALLAHGDFTGDGRVDLADFNILAANFGKALWP